MAPLELDFLRQINLNTSVESSGENWGGPRKGAGRKPGPTVRVPIRLPREVWASIEREAASRGTTPEEEATRILTQHVTAPLFR
jgi:hypothetical protein